VIFVKVTTIVVAAVLVALDAVANLVMRMLDRPVPGALDLIALGSAAALVLVAFVAHAFGRLDAKLDLLLELTVGRLADLETRLDERNLPDDCLLRRLADRPADPAARTLTAARLGLVQPGDR
jgi:hypothetical protein